MNKAVSLINRIKKNSNVALTPSSSVDHAHQNGEENVAVNDSIHSRHARLAHSLEVLLSDQSAISYFIQFFESAGKVNLINFWIHVKSFKDSTSLGNVSMAGIMLSDARRIFEKYVDDKSRNCIGLPKRIYTPLQENIENETVTDDLFNDAQQFVFHLFKLRYFDEFKQSIYYKRHELDILQNTSFDLEDLLYSQELMPIVMEMISDDFDRNRVQFILAVHTFESDCSDEVEADAMAIYERYISLQARMPIDISDGSRTQIESLICTPEGKPPRNCFDSAKKAVIAALTMKYRSGIVSSPLFRDYVNELKTVIDNTIELPLVNSSRSRGQSQSGGASSSNGTSISLPRSNDYLERRWSCSSSGTTVQSGMNSPKTSRLAEVDSLGRYKPLYDNSLVTVKKDGRIREKLRKYIDKDGLREEEMADEVARSIIEDVMRETRR